MASKSVFPIFVTKCISIFKYTTNAQAANINNNKNEGDA